MFKAGCSELYCVRLLHQALKVIGSSPTSLLPSVCVSHTSLLRLQTAPWCGIVTFSADRDDCAVRGDAAQLNCSSSILHSIRRILDTTAQHLTISVTIFGKVRVFPSSP